MLRRGRLLRQIAGMGVTLGEARERLQVLEAQATTAGTDAMLGGKLLHGRLTYMQLLAQTGRRKDAEECLGLGEQVWSDLEAASGAEATPYGNTRGVSLHVCTTMRRASNVLGDAARAQLWLSRFDERQADLMMPTMGGSESVSETLGGEEDGRVRADPTTRKKARAPMQFDDRGVRKNDKWQGKNGVDDLYNTYRHPYTGMPFMKQFKQFREHPNEGSFYTR